MTASLNLPYLVLYRHYIVFASAQAMGFFGALKIIQIVFVRMVLEHFWIQCLNYTELFVSPWHICYSFVNKSTAQGFLL